LNYAQCLPDGYGGAVCACQPGYTGSHCEIATYYATYGGRTTLTDTYMSTSGGGGGGGGGNYLNSNLNNNVNSNSYIADPCMSTPCLNGGFCIPATGFGYVCMCPIGTSGFNCDFYINQSCYLLITNNIYTKTHLL
jgi:hypothetical protein